MALLNQAIVHGADTDTCGKNAGRDTLTIHRREIETADASLNGSGIHNENELKIERSENISPDPTGKDEIKTIVTEKIEKVKEPEMKPDTDKDTKQEEAAIKKEIPKKTEPEKKKTVFSDKSGREYLGLFGGYGGHFPVADYGARFRASHLFSCALGIYALNLRGISPELHFRYTDMKSEHGRFMYDSSMKLTQFFPGLVYRHHFSLPHNTLTLYGRIWDGFCRIEYRSANPYFVFMKERIVEYVNIFGLSAGCYYDLFQGILIGADFSYSIAFTAGKPLQSVAVTLNAGYRIL